MWPLAGFCGREGPGRPDSGELTRWQRGLAVGGDRGEQELPGKGFGGGGASGRWGRGGGGGWRRWQLLAGTAA